MTLRVPVLARRAALTGLLLAAWAVIAHTAEDNKIGAAFGDDPAAFADPFPPEALQDKPMGACTGLLDHRVTDLRGRTVNLCVFSGKVLLVVNTASR